MYINEEDHAILRIEESIVLKDYDPREKSEQQKKFNKAIQFKTLFSVVNFKKYNGFYYLSDAHVKRTNGDTRLGWALAKADLIITAYKPLQSVCNPCNISFSNAQKANPHGNGDATPD